MSSAATRHGSRARRRTLVLIAAVLTYLLALAPAAARASGPAVSWGENFNGDLGAIYRDYAEERPVPVEGQPNIVSVSAGGGSNLALLSDGTVSAWGGNLSGQLGDGTRAASWEKGVSHVIVRELSGVAAVAAASEHALALLANGTVKAWGNNEFGQLGDGNGGFERETHDDENLPKPVPGLSEVRAISAAYAGDIALLANRTVEAWGLDNRGQLAVDVPERCRFGVGTGVCPEYECMTEMGWQLCSKVPRAVETINASGKHSKLEGVAAIAGGGESAYALLTNGHVMAWGVNGRGQLGIGKKLKFVESWVPPSEVMNARTGLPLSGVVAIAAGFNHVLALLEDGEVVGWGDNQKGALGPASEAICGTMPCDMSANPIVGLSGLRITSISAGVQYSLALGGGRVYSFGKDEHGELGNGGTSNSPYPQPIKGLEHVSAISAGRAHAAALLMSGTETPRPLVTLVPGKATLALSWAMPGMETVACGTFEPRGAEPGIDTIKAEPLALSAAALETRTLTIAQLAGKPLEARPYLIHMTAAAKKRVVVGTPLP
jgi:alpha-tubulin suppressor-like RCC1 family protein